jgi:protein O-mannosyl-transferase
VARKSKAQKRRPERPKPIASAENTLPVALASPASANHWLAAAALVAAVFLVYQPSWSCGFIWDDDSYVTKNKTLHDFDGLKRIWLERSANPQYYPLVHTVLWVEYQLWGRNPLGYHLMNLALHAANAVCLWLLLRRLNVPGAIWGASLFAVHPVMVESVAWVTELKNLLSTFFYLSGFLALLRFWPPEEGSPGPSGRWPYYGGALLLFTAALCSKTVTCSLPAAFLLVRWWKRGRLGGRDFCMTAPFFALGLAFALNTAALEKQQVGAAGAEWDLSLLQRTLIAGRALWFYVGKLLWPSQLTFIYPRWHIEADAWQQYLWPLAALAVIGALWALRGRIGRGPLTSALFFAGTLLPALGFFDVYPMRYSFVADHFQYLASAGLLAFAGAALARLGSSWTGNECQQRNANPRSLSWVNIPLLTGSQQWNANPQGLLAVAAGSLILVVLGTLTWLQVGVYKDLPTLWRDTIAKNPSCWMAHSNLGSVLLERDDLNGAIDHFQKALALKPDDAGTHSSLALAWALVARANRDKPSDEVIDHYRKALEVHPDDAEAQDSLGTALVQRGQFNEAIVHYRKALELKPDFMSARSNLAAAYFSADQVKESIEQYRKILELKPDYFEARFNLGVALASQDKRAEAIEQFQKALDLASARNNRAQVESIRARIDKLRK